MMKKDSPEVIFNTYIASEQMMIQQYNEESEMNIDLK